LLSDDGPRLAMIHEFCTIEYIHVNGCF
jgi:hypothetical protein